MNADQRQDRQHRQNRRSSCDANQSSSCPSSAVHNENNVFESGILNAFEITDAGGNAPLLNQIFKGLNISGVGVVDGVNITGSQAVRQNTTLNAYLLANNVGGFANFIAYNTFVTGIRGGLLKNGGLPPNLIAANPQFGSAYYISNDSSSTYNSGQVELNKRFAGGFSLRLLRITSPKLGSFARAFDMSTDLSRHMPLWLVVPSLLPTRCGRISNS